MQQYVIYGISDCPACLRACAELMSKYPSVEYVFVNTDFSKSYRKKLQKKYDFYTFPIIVLEDDNGEHLIGGYKELIPHFADPEMEYSPPPVRGFS